MNSQETQRGTTKHRWLNQRDLRGIALLLWMLSGFGGVAVAQEAKKRNVIPIGAYHQSKTAQHMRYIGMHEQMIEKKISIEQFAEVGEKQFNWHKNLATQHRDFEGNYATYGKGTFDVVTANCRIQYPMGYHPDGGHSSTYSYYRGFLEAHKLHHVLYIDGRHAIGMLHLIDHSNSRVYELISPFDGAFEPPVYSADAKQFFGFANAAFSTNTYLAAYQIDRSADTLTFENDTYGMLEGWQIAAAVWSGDETVVLKMKQEDLNQTNSEKPFRYFVLRFRNKETAP